MSLDVLTIQSSVSYGHVGNSGAVFAIRRAGIEAWPVDTVHLSHHPGYGAPGGRVRDPAELSGIIAGLDRIGVLSRVDAVLSGYLGSADTAAVVLDAVQRVKRQRDDALFVCDPVMGDADTGAYVSDEVCWAITEILIPAADVVVPNPFELAALTGKGTATMREVLDAARNVLTRGPSWCAVTSVLDPRDGPGRITTMAVGRRQAWRVTTPRLPLRAKGAGDILAAMLVARLLQSGAIDGALGQAVSSLFGIIAATSEVNADELRLVATQTAVDDPPVRFTAEAVG